MTQNKRTLATRGKVNDHHFHHHRDPDFSRCGGGGVGMTISRTKPRAGQPVIVSIIIDSDLWSVPVRARKRKDNRSFRIDSGLIWRGAVVKCNSVKVLI